MRCRLPAIFAGVHGSDDRAPVGAKPEDVGDQTLIRGFFAVPRFRPGLSLVYARASIVL
jgi:hypothetical protein